MLRSVRMTVMQHQTVPPTAGLGRVLYEAKPVAFGKNNLFFFYFGCGI